MKSKRIRSQVASDSFYFSGFAVLADYLQCSQVCYSYYEIGRRDIPTDALVRLARFYNTSVDYLLGLTDEKKPYPRTDK